MGIPTFSILRYQNNPAFFQINQALTISPVPGFSASSYSLSGPALPSGISFSTTTGVFSGTPTALMAAMTYTVTATLVSLPETSCEVVISIVDIPQTANLVNEASATGLTNLKLIAEQNFLASAEQMINQANQLGQFWINVYLDQYISFLWVYNYFTALNFTVVDLNPSNQSGQFASFFGEFPAFPGPNINNSFFPTNFTQPYPLVISKPVRKAKIIWTPFQGYLPFPFNPYPGP